MANTQSIPPEAPRRSKTPPPLPRVSQTAPRTTVLPPRHPPRQKSSSIPPPLPAAARKRSGTPREDDAIPMLRAAIEEAVAPLRARIEELERRSLAPPPVVVAPPVTSVPPPVSMVALVTAWRQWAPAVGLRIEKVAEVYSAYFDSTMKRVIGKP
jgi:hypothetical protein